MKYLALLLFPVAVFGQQVTSQPVKITADKNYSAIEIIGSTNQVANYLTVKNETGTIVSLSASGAWTGTGFSGGAWTGTATTNQIVFASTNAAPVDPTNVVKWVSVKVTGDTNAYRLPLYK